MIICAQIEFNNNGKYETELYVDGANGVGASKLRTLANLLASHVHNANLTNVNHHARLSVLDFHLFNEATKSDDVLNHLVI